VVQALLHQTEGQGLEAMDFEARTALHLAAEEGHADVVAVLLSQGAQANTSAQDGKTPLLAACAEGHLGVVQMLLQHVEGRALDVPDHYGDTALHLAAAEGYGEVIRALLLAGADPSMTDNKGRMPRVIWRMDEERRAQEDVFQVCTCMVMGGALYAMPPCPYTSRQERWWWWCVGIFAFYSW
jgi:hypothetical protein